MAAESGATRRAAIIRPHRRGPICSEPVPTRVGTAGRKTRTTRTMMRRTRLRRMGVPPNICLVMLAIVSHVPRPRCRHRPDYSWTTSVPVTIMTRSLLARAPAAAVVVVVVPLCSGRPPPPPGTVVVSYSNRRPTGHPLGHRCHRNVVVDVDSPSVLCSWIFFLILTLSISLRMERCAFGGAKMKGQ